MTRRRAPVSVDVYRGERVESRHEVDVALHADGAARGFGDTRSPVFLRSAAKPFQAVAVVRSGAADRFAIPEDELALIAASHSGEAMHTERVARLLSRLGLDASALGCGAHPPFHAETAARIGGRFTALHHNCSGKHAGMLALALRLGAPPGSYLDPDGPVQRTIRETIAAVCGLRCERIPTAIDGCSATTFAVPLAAAARAFSLLARPREAPADLREPIARVARAMARHPELVGGSGRFDTRLMQATAGRLLAKAGAEGVQGACDGRSGLGLCLKVRDGSARAVAPAALEVLRASGCLDAGALGALQDEWRPRLGNAAGKTVGRIEPRIRGR
ncbi:MAG: asparaginase [Deltaproteobacteria bacterium]|nr:asparaginase [Deltaproteobacteria bacterium]